VLSKNSVVCKPESRKKTKPETKARTNMLSQSQRTTVLELHAQGVAKREIARVLQISRLSVRRVLRSNSAQVPAIVRAEKAEPYRQQILELLLRCKGNLVRVHEELRASGSLLRVDKARE
jgi:DNA invertase Pin-like site-specific DNA recombinase